MENETQILIRVEGNIIYLVFAQDDLAVRISLSRNKAEELEDLLHNILEKEAEEGC